MQAEMRKWKIDIIQREVKKYDIKNINIDNIHTLSDGTIQNYFRQIEVASEFRRYSEEQEMSLSRMSDQVKELVKENKILRLQAAIRDAEDYILLLKSELIKLTNVQRIESEDE